VRSDGLGKNIDISGVDPLTFEGEIDMSVANKGDE